MKALTSLRDARPGDSERLAALAGQLGYPNEPLAVRQRLEAQAGRPGQRILVAEAEGRVIAWMGLEVVEHFYTPAFVMITGFVVDEACRGRGTGALMLAEAEAWTRAQGLGRLRLKANVLRTDAHRFYEAHGFVRTKEQYDFSKSLK